MYAQVSSITLQPGKVDEWLAITRDAILPAARERPGFVSAFILVDREKHTGIGISIWETEADAESVASSSRLAGKLRRLQQLDAHYIRAVHADAIPLPATLHLRHIL